MSSPNSLISSLFDSKDSVADVNVGRPSEPAGGSSRRNPDGTQRRRSSVFSSMAESLSSSPEGKRRFSWFGGRKNSAAGEEEITFKDVDLAGRE